MKKENKLAISKKYARAFLNLFYTQLNLNQIKKIEDFCNYISSNKDAFFYLNLGLINNKTKKKLFSDLIDKFELGQEIKDLLNLLISHNRLTLTTQTLKLVIALYKEKSNLMDFTIESSHPLEQSKIDKIVQFLENRIDKKIHFSTKINASLIAGIRALSNLYEWEYSIRKKINLLELN